MNGLTYKKLPGASSYFFKLNGDILGRVKKGSEGWVAQVEITGYEHIVITGKTKAGVAEEAVRTYLAR